MNSHKAKNSRGQGRKIPDNLIFFLRREKGHKAISCSNLQDPKTDFLPSLRSRECTTRSDVRVGGELVTINSTHPTEADSTTFSIEFQFSA